MDIIEFSNLPALDAPLFGGTYVGITTLPDGTNVAVSLLPDHAKGLTWQAAMDWAVAKDAQLPTRPMAALIIANTQKRPQGGSHWTCEEDKDDASCAWGCYFGYGYQSTHSKSYEGSAVAVRTIPLTA